ncbi:kinesin-like protein KIF27 isoform X2 [Syngnathoides biaculeatus]|uniref:kinesin-like protein KIF27 isoform X2 n=1 Tax=Syngnathoides biaculeatus TaxID=300417 RepID=UPI002ADD6702|nr:kinesin-like protein KIF27 isoform X2 [Syngnathoides biaculeatus]
MTEVRIRVAVRLRPLLPRELLHAHRECLRVVPGAPQVVLGSGQLFSFDHAFGPSASQGEVYESCVRPLTRSLLDGTNATVFCYGQTGSGKTYTLGGNKMDADGGIISCLARDVFSLLDKRRCDGAELTVGVSYLELYKEELRDLLELDTSHKDLQIRDDFRGNTVVVGAKEVAVSSCEELLNVLESAAAPADGPERLSKFCVVDLAGSERAGKTGNTGVRFEESVHINTGLLALGNVIRALAHPGRQRSAYIPYRHAKITRLLRDSLGGNACTLMVACVSPSHHSFAESLSVLKFASKSRRIRHRAEVATPDPDSEETFTAMLTSHEPPKYDVKCLKPSERDSTLEQEVIQKEVSPYASLVHQAVDLLAEVCGPDAQNEALTRKVHEWQMRAKAVNQSCRSEDDGRPAEGDSPHLVTIVQLRQDLKKCQESLETETQLLAQKDAKLKQAEKEVQELLWKQNVLQQTFCEENQQTERLVDQQILIDRLRCDLMAMRGQTPGTSCRARHRPHVAGSVRPSCGHMLISKIRPGPPAESLERLMATFKMSNQRLQSQEEAKDFCPMLKSVQGHEKDDFLTGLGWTSRQKKSALREKNFGEDRASKERPQQATWIKRQAAERSRGVDARQRAGLTQRRLQMLSANMCLKEELVKEIEKNEEEILAAVRREAGERREDGALAWLSEQSRCARLALRQSLQHMEALRARLQQSLRRPSPDSSDNSAESEADRLDSVLESRNKPRLKEMVSEACWLEEAEELELHRRAAQQELDEELRKSEEVRRRRDACLQRRSALETERLRSSQVLSQDLLRVSMRLETVEEKMASGTKQASVSDLEKEREMLRKRRDCLDAQLKDSTVHTVEEEQLEEAVQVLEAELDFKQRSIQDKQEDARSLAPRSSGSAEPRVDVVAKLGALSPARASELLLKYFSRVVDLRQTQASLRLYCDELEIYCAEQEAARGELEAAVHNLALDADRRLTQQQQEHHRNIGLLVSKLKDGNSSEQAQQVMKERLQNLEKELFFYKHYSRKLRKQLRESQCTQQTPPEPNASNDAKRCSRQQSPSSSSSSAENARTPAERQIGAVARCHGYSERRPPPPHGMRATLGLRRRRLRELAGPARDTVADTGIEMLSDDSLEASTGSETPDFAAV